MLSRRHIRIKVLQALYIYFNDDQKELTIRQAESALDKSIKSLFELYLYLLLFVRELAQFVEQYTEDVKLRYVKVEKDSTSAVRFLENPAIKNLLASKSFSAALKKHTLVWNAESDIVRKAFLDLKNQDIYKEYAHFGEQHSVLSQELVSFIVKHYPVQFSPLHQHLEEEFYNWQDDKKIALQMAVKSLQALAQGEEIDFSIEASHSEMENMEYARELLEKTISENDNFEKIIVKKTAKWEAHQIAMIDSIILKMAVCEFLYFPTIPAKVSINEYIELAKNYSTPQSKKFVNGILDSIQKDLRKEGKMLKAE